LTYEKISSDITIECKRHEKQQCYRLIAAWQTSHHSRLALSIVLAANRARSLSSTANINWHS